MSHLGKKPNDDSEDLDTASASGVGDDHRIKPRQLYQKPIVEPKDSILGKLGCLSVFLLLTLLSFTLAIGKRLFF